MAEAAETKPCPDCAESVKAAARVCRFCGYRFEELPTGAETEVNDPEPVAEGPDESTDADPDAAPEVEAATPPHTTPIQPLVPDDPPRSLAALSWLAIAGLVIAIAVELWAASADAAYVDVASRLLDGENVSDGEISDADNAVDATTIAQLLALVLVGPSLFLPWFFRAYRNLERMGVQDLRHGPGWAIGAWFIPIMSWIRPKRITNDLWRASAPTAAREGDQEGGWWREPVSNLVHWWWAAWLVGTLLAWIVSRILIAGYDDRLATRGAITDALERERAGFTIDIVSCLITVGAGVLAIMIVRRITARQRDRVERQELVKVASE